MKPTFYVSDSNANSKSNSPRAIVPRIKKGKVNLNDDTLSGNGLFNSPAQEIALAQPKVTKSSELDKLVDQQELLQQDEERNLEMDDDISDFNYFTHEVQNQESRFHFKATMVKFDKIGYIQNMMRGCVDINGNSKYSVEIIINEV